MQQLHDYLFEELSLKRGLVGLLQRGRGNSAVGHSQATLALIAEMKLQVAELEEILGQTIN